MERANFFCQYAATHLAKKVAAQKRDADVNKLKAGGLNSGGTLGPSGSVGATSSYVMWVAVFEKSVRAQRRTD
jgi:hypothetical protein